MLFYFSLYYTVFLITVGCVRGLYYCLLLLLLLLQIDAVIITITIYDSFGVLCYLLVYCYFLLLLLGILHEGSMSSMFRSVLHIVLVALISQVDVLAIVVLLQQKQAYFQRKI